MVIDRSFAVLTLANRVNPKTLYLPGKTLRERRNTYKISRYLMEITPPRGQRTLSLDRTVASAGGRKKRKAGSSPLTGQTERERDTLWLRLVSKIEDLGAPVLANPTTKLEIKKNSEELWSLAIVLSKLEETSDMEQTDESLETQGKMEKSFRAAST